MKFMKLGSKADVFHNEGNVTSVATDLSSDIVIILDGAIFHLHKFPLICKSGKLQKLITEARENSRNEIELENFPGSIDSFTMCMKFCYGIAITLNALSVVAVRCGAEYLEMTEQMEKGNLTYKLEVFLNTSLLRTWKDSILVLNSCKALLPLSEDLKITVRCIDSIASKTTTFLDKVDWSFTYTRAAAANLTIVDNTAIDGGSPPWNGSQSRRHRLVTKDWWAEDILELEMDYYWKVMVAIKAKEVDQHLVGEALRLYAYRWLPCFSKDKVVSRTRAAIHDAAEVAGKHRLLLETIVNLLPDEKGASSCSFLLKLLKAACAMNASTPCKLELAKRIGLQLEEATVDDLLIPTFSHSSETRFDVDLIQNILDHFLTQEKSPPVSPPRNSTPGESGRRLADSVDFLEGTRITSVSHRAKLRVAKLIDGYLTEIARDPNVQASKIISLGEAIPDFARPVHDGLYRAIDMYLKEHPNLSKSERKRLCRLMDCKKLSMDACMHAAQNERLPLRVVVQVLFFEQLRNGSTGGVVLENLPANIRALLPPAQVQALKAASLESSDMSEAAWDAVHHNFNMLKGDLAEMKKRISEAERERSSLQPETDTQIAKQKLALSLPSISKKIPGEAVSATEEKSREGTKTSDRSSDGSTRDSDSPASGSVLIEKPTAHPHDLLVT